MKILIAPDKFKGTLTAGEAARAIARGWRRARPNDDLVLHPISDGGDGFGELMSRATSAEPLRTRTLDAAHHPCNATWWWHAKTRTAIIESSRIIGLAMLPPRRFHPFQLDTSGLGKVIQTAACSGAKRILIGIGGSATNDGGFGLARALGWRFLDTSGREIVSWTGLHRLSAIIPSQNRFPQITVAVDVQNRLLGSNGATRTYGPQKGLRPDELAAAESNLRRLVKHTPGGQAASKSPGNGAAGGLGFGLAVFCGARLRPGFGLFAANTGLRRQIRESDIVITGEGALDRSSFMGKGVGELTRMCRAANVPCIGLCGRVEANARQRKLFERLIALTEVVTERNARKKPASSLEAAAHEAARVIQ